MTQTTQILDANDPDALKKAYALLKSGDVVAFPTETVYGLGANGLDPAAVAKIFKAKGRPGDNPLILHVSSIEHAIPLWQTTDERIDLAILLAEHFWPGPLSLVLPAASGCTQGSDRRARLSRCPRAGRNRCAKATADV